MKKMVMPSTFSVLENEEMMNLEGGCQKHKHNHHNHNCCPKPVVICRPVVICKPVICKPVHVFGC